MMILNALFLSVLVTSFVTSHFEHSACCKYW